MPRLASESDFSAPGARFVGWASGPCSVPGTPVPGTIPLAGPTPGPLEGTVPFSLDEGPPGVPVAPAIPDPILIPAPVKTPPPPPGTLELAPPGALPVGTPAGVPTIVEPELPTTEGAEDTTVPPDAEDAPTTPLPPTTEEGPSEFWVPGSAGKSSLLIVNSLGSAVGCLTIPTVKKINLHFNIEIYNNRMKKSKN